MGNASFEKSIKAQSAELCIEIPGQITDKNIVPYHVVPDEPEMYETQSRSFILWRPQRVPYMAAKALIPPPVVVTAMTGTCSTEQNVQLSEKYDEKMTKKLRKSNFPKL